MSSWNGWRWPGALAHRGFRRLSLALALSSFGDWLGFLAMTAMATQLVDGFDAKSFAVGGVLAFRLLPAVVLAPVVGVLADRFDRRAVMVITDLLRFGLFLSIPLVDRLAWLLVASALVEVLSLMWIPAKEASVPTLAKGQLESANQISLFLTYGTAPVAAVALRHPRRRPSPAPGTPPRRSASTSTPAPSCSPRCRSRGSVRSPRARRCTESGMPCPVSSRAFARGSASRTPAGSSAGCWWPCSVDSPQRVW